MALRRKPKPAALIDGAAPCDACREVVAVEPSGRCALGHQVVPADRVPVSTPAAAGDPVTADAEHAVAVHRPAFADHEPVAAPTPAADHEPPLGAAAPSGSTDAALVAPLGDLAQELEQLSAVDHAPASARAEPTDASPTSALDDLLDFQGTSRR